MTTGNSAKKQAQMRGLAPLNRARKARSCIRGNPHSVRLPDDVLQLFVSVARLHGLGWADWLRQVGILEARRVAREQHALFQDANGESLLGAGDRYLRAQHAGELDDADDPCRHTGTR